MTRAGVVYHAPLTGAADAATVSGRAAQLVEAVLGDLELPRDLPLAYHLQDHNRRRAEEQFLGWTVPVLDRLRERGHALTTLAPAASPSRDAVGVPLLDAAVPFASLARDAHAAPGLLVGLRLESHPRSGLAGAVRATALACASADGKLALQSGVQPRIERSVCGGCGMCVTLCGNDGVRHNGHVAVIRPETCLACGDCLAECHTGALRFPEGGSAILQARLGAYAAAVVRGKPRRGVWLAFLLGEPQRRAVNLARAAALPDLGVLAAADPVALDLAAASLLESTLGRDWTAVCHPDLAAGVDPLAAVREAARLGAGGADIGVAAVPRLVTVG